MRTGELLSGWETFILIAPFAALLVLSVFGLDGHLARRRPTRGGRLLCELQPEGETLLRDPDGRLCYPARPHRWNQSSEKPVNRSRLQA